VKDTPLDRTMGELQAGRAYLVLATAPVLSSILAPSLLVRRAVGRVGNVIVIDGVGGGGGRGRARAVGEGCWCDLSSSLLLCLGRSREDLSFLQIGPRAAPWLSWFLLIVAIINKITGPYRTYTCFGASVGRPIPVLNDVPIKGRAPSFALAFPPSHTPTHLVSEDAILVLLILVVAACQ